VAVAAAVAVLAACGSTGPTSPPRLNGNFAGEIFGTGLIGFSLRDTAGTVTGFAWSAFNLEFSHGLAVTGTLTDTHVSLTLVPPKSPDHSYGFTGTFERDTLRGQLLNGPGRGFTVEAVRIDTVPTGTGSITVRGADSLDAVGYTSFSYLQGSNEPSLIFNADPPFSVGIGLGFPAFTQPGVYLVGTGRPAGGMIFIGRPFEATTYLAIGGTIRIDRSNRIALIGHFDFTARADNGDTVSVTGPFSAGCAAADC
jgi:hypothetical protein